MIPLSSTIQEDLVLIRVACLMRIHPEVLWKTQDL